MTVPSLAHPQKAHHQCSACGRTLRTPGRLIPILNMRVGPTCYERYAATPKLLQQSGLGVFLEGPVKFQLVRHQQEPGRWWWPAEANRLARKAISLGLRFQVNVDAITGVGTLTLTNGQSRTARERLRKAFMQLEEASA